MAANSPRPDAFLGGRLSLRQPGAGHRAGTDAVLLAACLPSNARGRAVDVGAGVGAAGLSALSRAAELDMTCVEIDPALTALCAQNIADNGLADRARAVTADVLKPVSRRAADLADGGFDWAMTNPPFLDPSASRVSPDAAKARAHVAEGGLEAWMKASAALLAPGGLFLMIHRADALADILSGVKGRIGGLRLMPVHARAGEPAVRLLVSGKKGSRAPLAILPPLVLHGADGRFTCESQAIHRGEAGTALIS